MDDISKRLRESSQNCLERYEAWRGNKKDSTASSALNEAIHELRKIASRLEIDLAISERDEMPQKPIPIPPHRDVHRRVPMQDHEGGGMDEQDFSGQPPRQPNQGGGPGGGGMHRRRLGRRSENQ